MKLHSACALSHSALDAVLVLELLPAAEEVEGVEVETVSNNLKIAQQARSNDLSTRFSLPYATAAAIVHGHTRPEAFVPDRRVAGLAQRVEVRGPDLEDAWPDAAPARVTVRTRNATYTQRVDNPRGHYSNPASADELRGKFELLVGGEDAGYLYERLLNMRRWRTWPRSSKDGREDAAPGASRRARRHYLRCPRRARAQLSRAGGQRPVGLSSGGRGDRRNRRRRRKAGCRAGLLRPRTCARWLTRSRTGLGRVAKGSL